MSDEPIGEKGFCACKEKIIRKPDMSSFTDPIIYCEKCNLPILAKDRDKIVDDWRHMRINP